MSPDARTRALREWRVLRRANAEIDVSLTLLCWAAIVPGGTYLWSAIQQAVDTINACADAAPGWDLIVSSSSTRRYGYLATAGETRIFSLLQA